MTSISGATSALLQLLERECPREHFPYAVFTTYQADDFTSPMEEGVSLYLYKVDMSDGALSLSYLVTAWSPDPVRQQQLLGWTLDTVKRNHELDARLRLEIERLTIADLAALWNMARTGAQLSIAVIVRSVQAD